MALLMSAQVLSFRKHAESGAKDLDGDEAAQVRKFGSGFTAAAAGGGLGEG